MAINRRTLITRTLTGAIFIAVMLVGLLWNRWSFIILFSIIHFGCWVEYLKMSEKIFKTTIDRINKYLLMILGFVIFLIVGLGDVTNDFGIYIGSFFLSVKWMFWFAIVFCVGIFLFQSKKISSKAKCQLAVGFAYISLSLGLMVSFYKPIDIQFHKTTYQCSAHFIPVAIAASIWVNDTMAYLIGSLIGKTSLSKISPKKTWEGTIGGIITSIAVVWLSGFYVFHYGYLTYLLLIITSIASITGTFGDLLESKLKRMADVKDSGHLMPGHGGFLDRFDSLLLAIPFVWCYVQLFIR